MKKSSQLTPSNIIKTLDNHKKEIHKCGVKKIGLFGSFLKKRQRKTSDIDFLVVLKKPTFDKYMDLKFMLENLFSKRVDLVLEENLKPALRYVKKEAIYAKGI